jgi:hypothetical protein
MITDITDVTLTSKQSTTEQQCHGRNLCKNGFQSFFYTKIHHIIRKFSFYIDGDLRTFTLLFLEFIVLYFDMFNTEKKRKFSYNMMYFCIKKTLKPIFAQVAAMTLLLSG